MLHLLGNYHEPLDYLLVQLLLIFFSKLVITQFADLKVKDTSQLINGIFKLFQKLPSFFNGTAITITAFFISAIPSITSCHILSTSCNICFILKRL